MNKLVLSDYPWYKKIPYEEFLPTTAIDYANGSPHLGHAYEKILADVIARTKRL